MPDNETTNNQSNFYQDPALQSFFETLSPLAQKAQFIANHPAQAELKRAAIAEYNRKIKAYKELALILSNKEIEDLIWSIHSGKNTFEDLKKVVPKINSATICSYLVDEPKLRFKDENLILNIEDVISLNNKPQYYFQFAKIPNNFYAPYEFEPTDSFKLTITAENLIYQLEKERYMQEIAEKSLAIANDSLRESKESTKYSKYAMYAAIVSIFISVLIALFPVFLSYIE